MRTHEGYIWVSCDSEENALDKERREVNLIGLEGHPEEKRMGRNGILLSLMYSKAALS